MNTIGKGADISSFLPPTWLKEALELDKQNESSQIIGADSSPAHEEPERDHPESCAEKNETKRKGAKRKKEANKKEKEPATQQEDSGICGGESECVEATERLGAVQEKVGDELDVRFRLLRDNYCALRHHYGQLRKQYQNLERKHGKCALGRKKPSDRARSEGEGNDAIEEECSTDEDGERPPMEIEENEQNVGNAKKKKVQRKRKNTKCAYKDEESDDESKKMIVIML